MPENRRAAGMQAIDEALGNSLVAGRPGIKVFERSIYESWIDSQFDRDDEARSDSAAAANGTIEIIWEVEERNGTLEFDGDSYVARVVVGESSYGNSADDALNGLIGDVPGVNRPLDFRVRKKACFRVDNVMPGGRSKVCWLLDKDNGVLRTGVGSIDMAERAYADDTWRRNTTRFRRP
jgi:hypothetical protein